MRYNPTERMGVNAIERIVIEELKWIFREQPIVDVGIDALIEVVNDGTPSCQFIATQIKSGKGNFHENEKSWTYYTSDIHYNYWLNSNLPVILIAYIPEESVAYWVYVETGKFIRTKRQWKIDVPRKQLFNAGSQKRLLALIDSQNGQLNQREWSLERIEELDLEVKNISKAAECIDAIAFLLQSFRVINDELNKEYRVLIGQGMNLKSPQTKKVTQKLINSIWEIIPPGEKHIQEFSELFAIGIEALTQIIQGCKEFNLRYILEQILPVLENFVSSSEIPIRQTIELRNTVDNFTKYDQKLKSVTTSFSELLSQVIREFKVSVTLTENIIEVIKNNEI